MPPGGLAPSDRNSGGSGGFGAIRACPRAPAGAGVGQRHGSLRVHVAWATGFLVHRGPNAASVDARRARFVRRRSRRRANRRATVRLDHEARQATHQERAEGPRRGRRPPSRARAHPLHRVRPSPRPRGVLEHTCDRELGVVRPRLDVRVLRGLRRRDAGAPRRARPDRAPRRDGARLALARRQGGQAPHRATSRHDVSSHSNGRVEADLAPHMRSSSSTRPPTDHHMPSL